MTPSQHALAALDRLRVEVTDAGIDRAQIALARAFAYGDTPPELVDRLLALARIVGAFQVVLDWINDGAIDAAIEEALRPRVHAPEPVLLAADLREPLDRALDGAWYEDRSGDRARSTAVLRLRDVAWSLSPDRAWPLGAGLKFLRLAREETTASVRRLGREMAARHRHHRRR